MVGKSDLLRLAEEKEAKRAAEAKARRKKRTAKGLEAVAAGSMRAKASSKTVVLPGLIQELTGLEAERAIE